jgi:hypothetical protein
MFVSGNTKMHIPYGAIPSSWVDEVQTLSEKREEFLKKEIDK